jgi:hypothetical protein
MSGQDNSSGTLRRTVLKVGGGAIGGAAIGGGALLYTSQPAAAATQVNTMATVELDSNQQDVTGVTIAPEIGFNWSDFSNGVNDFQLDVEVTTQAGLDEQAMNSLLPDGDSIDASTIETSWNNQASKTSAIDVVSSSEFSTDGSGNSDVSDVTAGSDTSFSDASGNGTVLLTEQALTQNSFSDKLYPQEIGDDVAAGTRVTINITLDVRDDSSSEATIDYDTIEYGVIVDNPSSSGSEDDTTLNSDASGE